MTEITHGEVERAVDSFKRGERPWPLRPVDWFLTTPAGDRLPLKYIYALATDQPPANFSTGQAKAVFSKLGYEFTREGTGRKIVDGKSRGINAFFNDGLGAPLANGRWSWGAVDERNRRVFLRLWRHEQREVSGRAAIQVLNKAGSPSRPGWNERRKHIELVKAGYSAYGVICDRKDPDGGPILGFDTDSISVLGAFIEDGDKILAEVLGSVSPENLKSGQRGEGSLVADLKQLEQEPGLSSTTRLALVEARLGQGKYRSQLLDMWARECSVTGCSVKEILRASHCKPWRDSDNRERLDANNGLMLVANLDALFDVGLIAFRSDGSMLVSEQLSKDDQSALGIPANLRRTPNSEQAQYLNLHRQKWFSAPTHGSESG